MSNYNINYSIVKMILTAVILLISSRCKPLKTDTYCKTYTYATSVKPFFLPNTHPNKRSLMPATAQIENI